MNQYSLNISPFTFDSLTQIINGALFVSNILNKILIIPVLPNVSIRTLVLPMFGDSFLMQDIFESFAITEI